MAHQEQLDLLKQGVEVWNRWREEHPVIRPELSGANLSGANLRGVNLSGANLKAVDLSGADLSFMPSSTPHLSGADLSGANLMGANLRGAHLPAVNLSRANLRGAHLDGADLTGKANLSDADLSGADLFVAFLSGANLRGVNLSGANLMEANLMEANLMGANLSGADLTGATLVRADLRKATLTNCRVYGISVWDVNLAEADQSGLIITLMPSKEPIITVDNLKVAQFIYLLLNNKEIRDVIETITSKVVLILGRFTPERKAILDALRNELRKHNYSPILFDFEKPASRDLTETVSILAHLARFIIVDLTDPSSAPYEVATIVPQTMVPVQPLLLREPLMVDGKAVERHEFAMFEDLRRRYHWVLPTFRYQDTAELLNSLKAQIIAPSEQKARELTQS